MSRLKEGRRRKGRQRQRPATCYISNDACGTNTQPVGPVRLGQFTRRIDDASSGSLVRFPRQVPFERWERGSRGYSDSGTNEQRLSSL